MKDKQYKRRLSIKTFLLQLAIAFAFLFGNTTCSKPNEPEEKYVLRDNLMVVYSNAGKEINLVDYNTFEVVKTITLELEKNIQVDRMCLSTNKDYLIFSAGDLRSSNYTNYFLVYSLAEDKINKIFKTGLNGIVSLSLTAVYNSADPWLVYVWEQKIGLYSVNFITEEVKAVSNKIGSPYQFFYTSPDRQWLAISKYYPGYDKDYTDVEFYNTNEGLSQPSFILNENDQDGVDIMDLDFSEDNKKLYMSYLLSQRRAVYQAAFFGSYDLETKQKESSYVTLPWSSNPYYIAHSPKRKEAYMVGAQDKFYIIDLSAKDYQIKGVVDLTGKIPNASEILIRPDENIAFVSCKPNNLIYVIDLESRQVIKKIEVNKPYFMLLLT